LRGSRLAADLDEDECRVLSELVSVRDLADGEVLAPEGTADNHLYVVAKGELDVVRESGTEGPVIAATLCVGDLAGELNFIDGTTRQTSLVARGSTRVLGLERERLESLLATHPTIVYHVMRAIIRTVHETQRRLSLQAAELVNYIYKRHGRY
jgi:CRP/FNR family cyclic AMP-dependent transcriptional regulator